MKKSKIIEEKLKLLPDLPGCYLMKNDIGTIIYVGKAKSLKNRVRQYFVGAHDLKTTRLVLEIVDFEYIITNSEKDSLLLEINLIKKYDPKYNIALKDDKSYPYIKLSKENAPILKIVRNTSDKNAYYFGPYPDVYSARETVQLLNRIYPLRKCKVLPKKECLYYHLGQCLAPCVFKVEQAIYDDMVKEIRRFLNGDTKLVIEKIKKRMQKYSDNLEFERAQESLELIKSIEHVVQKSQVQLEDKTDKDLFHYYSENSYICIQAFLIRQGKLLERVFKVRELYDLAEETFISFILQYYEENTLPKEIILPNEIDISALKEVLDTKITQPQRGEKRKMLLTVYENAKKQLNNHFKLVHKEEKAEKIWEELQEKLNLTLRRVEVFDNSHTAASFNVSGMIVIEDGYFMKKEYRHFKLADYQSDVHSMKEVIYRRYYRLLMEEKRMPDAIFVDGGIQQINAAKEVLDDLNLDIKLFGIVKDEKHRSANLLDVNGDIVAIDKKSQSFFLLMRIQDEVHRYVINFHRNIRSKNMVKSFLDDIKGLGASRKTKLLKEFKTIKAIKEASIEQLNTVIPLEVAKAIIEKVADENKK